jgi:hypothetical protein
LVLPIIFCCDGKLVTDILPDPPPPPPPLLKEVVGLPLVGSII